MYRRGELALLQATETNLESIFLLAPDEGGALARALEAASAAPPAARAELDGVAMRLWVVGGNAAVGLAAATTSRHRAGRRQCLAAFEGNRTKAIATGSRQRWA